MRTSKAKINKEVLSREVLSGGTLDNGISGKEVPSKDVPNRGDKVQKPRPLSVVDVFIGKDISITLRSGGKLEGKLESVVQYEMVVTVSHQPVIVMKHAIDYIELVSKD